MSKVKFTEEQLEAIKTRNCNLLVAAAAGSGKTAVLVERIINMITDIDNPVNIDKLLVVTFTNAAAAEMRERIGEAITKKINENPTSRRLQKQLTLLNKASITTIHSFCLEVIKRNFHMIDIDPRFKVADETETVLLKQEALEEVFEELYEENDEDFLRLIECYCNNKSDSYLFETVLSLYNFAMSTSDPIGWLEEKAKIFNIEDNFNIEDSQFGEIVKEDAIMSLKATLNLAETYKNLVNNNEYLEKYRDIANLEYENIKGIFNSINSLGELNDKLQQISFDKLPTIRGCKDKLSQDEVKDIRKSVKDSIQKIGELVNSTLSERTKDDFKYLYPLMKKLSEIVILLKENYDKKKRQRAVIDFNDFEHFALKILTEKDEEGNIIPSKVAMELSEKYEEILIDEYQDSNYIQEDILNMVSRIFKKENNVFRVGDVKQSIYKFRMAKPELFIEKKNNYSEEKGSDERLIKLYKNFRSRKEVIDSVNFIFKNIMSDKLGGLDYTDDEALNLGADYKVFQGSGVVGGSTELILLDKSNEKKDLEEIEDNVDEEESEPLSSIQIEAQTVGKRIRELIDDGKMKVFDKELNEYRNVEYKDIVILLRATFDYASVFSEELKLLGIPVYADANSGYFESLEIKTMLSLLQIIDNPDQDIPLLAILRSPIGGFSAEEVVDIRLESPQSTIYDAIIYYVHNYEHTLLGEKLKVFLQNLKNWREKSLIMPIDEFIWSLYMKTGYYGYVGAMPAGIQRQANLKVLFQRARQYESTSYKGLFNFVNFINKLKVSSGDLGSAKVIGENENVVRIMSIHKSKGLEFPIVFLSTMGKNFNKMDLRNKILFHHDLGFGPELVNLEKRISYPSIAKEILKTKINLENLSEEIRVLYVAFTRAKEKLIITGTCKNYEDDIKRWYSIAKNSKDKILEGFLLKGKSYLDWIMPCILKHKDGEVLREYIGKEENIDLAEDNSNWKVVISDGNIGETQVQEEERDLNLDKKIKELQNKNINEKIKDEIKERLDFNYKYKKSTKLDTALTISELKRIYNENLDVENTNVYYTATLVKKPNFMKEEKGLSPAEKGTAMHSVMQRLDFSRINTKEEIQDQINVMVEKQMLTEEQAKSIRIEKIIKFFQSDLGKRVIEAEKENKFYREVPFSMELSAVDIYDDLDKETYKNEKIKIQGIIDGYFEAGEDIVIFDYKTDYVLKENVEEIVSKYKMQIEYYIKAIELGTNKKVKEKYLYLFSINDFVKI